MKIFKRLFCTHDYRLGYTCTHGSKYEEHILKIEKCKKCGKIRKSII